jgi:adenylate kinase
MDAGELVPDNVIIGVIVERMESGDALDGFLLDGFPRTIGQAQGLEVMTGGDPHAWLVFDFEVPRDVLMLRLSGRRWCPSCQATYHLQHDPPKQHGVCDACGTGLVQREDDHESVVAQRLAQYAERTFPLIAHYRARARMIPVDGNRAMGAVFRELLEAVEVRA